jgi:purine-cytosine permease-like protein
MTEPADAVPNRRASPDPLEPSVKSIERRGIEYIPHQSRWGKPVDLFWMWAGAVWNVEFVIYGALAVVVFRLSFIQAAVVILLGNLFYALTGVGSLQGPAAGTTTFAVSRASFGPNGNRLPSFFNWATLVGYEIAGVTIIVLAGVALTGRAGFHAGTPAEIIYIVIAVAIQAALPTLGHAAILKVLRWLATPFFILFVIMAIITAPKVAVHAAGSGAGWGALLVFLALVISGGGLSWTETANDYSRYLDPATDKARIVLAVVLGGAIPSIALEILGAAVATGVPKATTVEGLTAGLPGWFIVPYLVVAMAQLFASNTLNLYSSGVTLQSLVSRLTRLQCVATDTIICGSLAAYAIFSARFFSLLSDFLLFTIVWLAPWAAIYLVDAWLRRNRYDHGALLHERGGLYYRQHGVHLPAVIGLMVGMVAAALWLNAYSPYVGPLASRLGGSDLSVFMGMIFGGTVYWLLARKPVRAEAETTSVLPLRREADPIS